MKKKTLTISLILLLFTANIQSQVLMTLIFGDKLNTGGVEFGLSGGLNYGQISNMTTGDYFHDWNLGFYFNLRLKESQWYIYTGTLVKAKMGSMLDEADVTKLGLSTYPFIDGDYTQKVNYFIVPVFLKYRFKNRIHLEAGPQFSLRYNADVEFNYSDGSGNTVIVKQDNKDMLNSIDAGIGIGAGYRFNNKATGATIGVKYYYGFVNAYKGINSKNNAFFLQFDIPIGASDCAQQKKKEDARKKAEKKALRKAKKENKN